MGPTCQCRGQGIGAGCVPRRERDQVGEDDAPLPRPASDELYLELTAVADGQHGEAVTDIGSWPYCFCDVADAGGWRAQHDSDLVGVVAQQIVALPRGAVSGARRIAPGGSPAR